jgi:Ca2+:H+ antiporter
MVDKSRVIEVLKPLLYVVIIGASVVLHFIGDRSIAQFVLAIIGLVPLAGVIGDATEELGELAGDIVGGILSASFGNAPELIFSFVALYNHQDELLKATLIGSVIANTLMVLGSSLMVGSYKNGIQKFVKGTIHNLGATLLIFSGIYLSYPTILKTMGQYGSYVSVRLDIISSLIMIVIYVSFTIFQIKYKPETLIRGLSKRLEKTKSVRGQNQIDSKSIEIVIVAPDAIVTTSTQTPSEPHPNKKKIIAINIFKLCVASGLVALLSDIITSTVTDFSVTVGINSTFIGFIIIAITGNAAEHWTAMKSAYDNEIDLAITTVITSGLQISALIYPIIILFSFIRETPMDMALLPLEAISYDFAIILVWFVMSDDKTNWVEGLMLFSFYIILATIFFVVF